MAMAFVPQQLLKALEPWRQVVWALLGSYLVGEVIFFVYFRYYLVPMANRRTPTPGFRDYGHHRHLMLLRIIDRIYRTCVQEGCCIQDTADHFLREWFLDVTPKSWIQRRPVIAVSDPDELDGVVNKSSKDFISPPVPLALRESSSTISDELLSDEPFSSSESFGGVESSSVVSSSSSSSAAFSLQGASRAEITAAIMKQYAAPPRPFNASPETLDFIQRTTPTPENVPPRWTVEGIQKSDMDDFLCWALFSKNLHELHPWEMAELAQAYHQIETRAGLVFLPGRSTQYKPVRLSLEDCDYEQRPLVFYAIFYIIRILSGIWLRLAGFQRVVSAATGVTGWYRPARTCAQDGSATAANELLPLLFFHGIAPGGLFFYLPMLLLGLVHDGRCAFFFENPIITFNVGFDAARSDAAMVQGITEIVDRFVPRSRGLSLCGHSFGSCPLTWLLHAPAFRHRIQQFVLLDPVTLLLSEPAVIMNFLYPKSLSKVGLASSELFIQHYLRRHFSWANSELWLEDIPASVRVLVGLAERDEVLNAPKVRKQVELFANKSTTKVCYWERATHAYCVLTPSSWREIKQVMLEQELSIVQEQKQHAQ